MIYDRKVVCCGNVLEIYEYKEPIKTGYSNKIEKKKREQTKEIKLENYNRSLKRTRTKIRHLINTNYVPGKSSFLTITFKENMRDYDVAFNCWKRFKQKAERYFCIKLSYLGVVEFQKKNFETTGRCAIHFHIVLFNVPFLKHSELYRMWNEVTNGGVHIEQIEDKNKNCDNVGAYMTKYLSKQNVDFFDNEFKGKKRYFKSKDLKEPEVVKMDMSYQEQREYYDNFMEQLKDSVVFEYTSKEFEITKKQEIISYHEFEDVDTGDIVYIEKEKELNEEVIAIQQLTYKQIVLEKNNLFRI